MENPYLPQTVKVLTVSQETPEIKKISYGVKIKSFQLQQGLAFIPGQFVLAGVWGAGESPFGLANSPYQLDKQELVIRATGGSVTSALHRLKPGDTMTIRGPYGNGFPLELLPGHDIVVIAGGCGLPPLAALLEYLAHQRLKFGQIFLVYGASGPQHFALKKRFSPWRKKKIEITLTIDHPPAGGPTKAWRGRTGFVSDHLANLPFDPEKTFVLMCGPGPMFTASAQVLLKLGLPEQRIYLSQERKMNCGIGKCQHCTCGKFYVCQDGPVFSYDQIKNVPD